MLISKRMANLLEKAARCFDDGKSPFRHEWLCDNEVTFTECVQLSELIGAVLRGFVKSTDKAQTEIWLLSPADGDLPAQMMRAFSEQREVVKRLESIIQSHS
jgi:hypothetical protein